MHCLALFLETLGIQWTPGSVLPIGVRDFGLLPGRRGEALSGSLCSPRFPLLSSGDLRPPPGPSGSPSGSLRSPWFPLVPSGSHWCQFCRCSGIPLLPSGSLWCPLLLSASARFSLFGSVLPVVASASVRFPPGAYAACPPVPSVPLSLPSPSLGLSLLLSASLSSSMLLSASLLTSASLCFSLAFSPSLGFSLPPSVSFSPSLYLSSGSASVLG